MAEIRIWQVPERLKILLKIAAAEDQATLNDTYIRALTQWVEARKPRK